LSEFEEQVLSLLKKIDEKLNKLLSSNSIRVETVDSTNETGDEYVKPSKVVEKQEEEEKVKEKPPVEGRRVCPACGGTTFNTEEDKSQVLFQQAGISIFAKRYICKNCGTEA